MKLKTPLILLALCGFLTSCGTSEGTSDASGNQSGQEDTSQNASDNSSTQDLSDTSYNPDTKEGYTVVKKASTYQDLPVMSSHKNDKKYWSIASPYKGKRDDFRDESIYFVMTTRFYNGDKSNDARCWDGKNNAADDPEWRGDFKGLIEKMEYIKALGFTAIWITPVVKNASGYDYHGYHAINHKQVDPRYESEDVKFIDVIKEAHKRDMKIVLDIVLNHTCNFGEENLYPLYKKKSGDYTYDGMVLNDKSLVKDGYETMDGGNQFRTRVESMKDDTYDKNQIYHNEKHCEWEQYSVQTGQMADDCVDLNTENPTVANYLVEAYGEFIRMGVDAFRIDTMKHISRLTFNNYYFPAFQEFAKKCGNPNFHMFGEVCTRVREVWNKGVAAISCPFYSWKESKKYSWGDTITNLASAEKNYNDNSSTTGQPESKNYLLNDNLSYRKTDYSMYNHTSVIDFPMHWNFQYARDAYNVAVGSDKYYNDATYNVVYVDSHDYAPDCIAEERYNMGTDAWKENMSLMFTFRGVPCIFYGSEMEFQKGKPIDKGPTIALKDSGRAYYGDNLEGTVKATDFGKYTASGTVNSTLNKTLSKHLQMLNKIRLQVPALRRGQYKSVGEMAFIRRYTSESTDSIACVTISHGQTFTGLPGGTYKDLVSGNSVTISNNGSLTASVSGQGNLAVYVKQ